MKQDSRSTSFVDRGPQTLCLSRVRCKTEDSVEGLDTNLSRSQLIRDAAKRTFQITSLQAFSKYSVVYVYLNGSMLSLPSPCPFPHCRFGVGFVPVFSETTLEPRWGPLCFGRFLSVGPEL